MSASKESKAENRKATIKIREAMFWKDMTIKYLADVCGTSRTYMSLVINGHKTPSPKVMELIAKELDMPVGKLFFGE